MIHGCKTLYVAQDSDNLSIWFVSSSDQLGYIRTTISNVAAASVPRPTLLLPAGKTTSFAPCILNSTMADGRVIWQRLISNDKFGNLTLLEQGSDLGLWRQKPFYSSDNSENFLVQSYSMTIKAFNGSGSTIRNALVQISSASAVTGILNGRTVTLTSVGNWYRADEQGALNFIVPTDSIASQVLVIGGIKDSKGIALKAGETVMDPTSKLMTKLGAKLDSFKSSDDLKNARTDQGAPLFDPKNMPIDDDLTQGLKCLRALHSAYTSLPADGSSSQKPNTPMHMVSLLASQSRALSMSLDDVGNWFMDGWHWVKQKWHEAKDWFVETAGWSLVS